MSVVFKYRMLVQARTDLTEEEIAKYEASKGANGTSPSAWPMRDTGTTMHARRAKTACAFYRALKQIAPIIKIRAVKINGREPRRDDDIAFRAWRGFQCLSGIVSHGGKDVGDEVKHFAVDGGLTACGIRFVSAWTVNGKPECDVCLAVAVNCHPEMKQYL